jgi:type II secretory pathway pseudopilin PulG
MQGVRSAFTFVEVLAALAFMAIVVPVAMRGVQVANRAGVVAERKGVAVRLAQTKLEDLVVTGDWHTGVQQGQFEGQWKDYRWRSLNEPWSQDSMRLISVEVTYAAQNQDYTVLLSTLVVNN